MPAREDGVLVANLPIRSDPRYVICERAQEDARYQSVLEQLDAGRRLDLAGRRIMNMDGPLFHDTRAQSIITSAQTAITLAATDKLLYPGTLTALPAQYFSAGKKVQLTIYGSMTTVLTPGNLGLELYYGSTDAGGTLLASSAVVALTASKTTIPVVITAQLVCRGGAVPTAVPVLPYCTWISDQVALLIPAANNPMLVPAVPAAVNIDTTAAQGFNVQIKRSGSTAETFTTHDITFTALN